MSLMRKKKIKISVVDRVSEMQSYEDSIEHATCAAIASNYYQNWIAFRCASLSVVKTKI